MVVFSSTTSAQFNVNTNPFWEAEVLLLDGTKKSGFVQVPNIGAIRKIQFKETERGATEAIEREEIATIKVTSEKGKSFYFDNLPVGSVKKDKVSKKRYLMLTQAKNNYVTFYAVGTYNTNNKTGEIVLMDRYVQGKDFPMYSYYLSKGDKSNAKL